MPANRPKPGAGAAADVLRERTVAVNAIFPNGPARDTRLWLYAGGGHGAWRQFSTAWAELLLAEIRPLAILLLGREARLAMGRRLPPLGVVEVPDFADPGAQDDSLYDTPSGLLRRLLGRAL